MSTLEQLFQPLTVGEMRLQHRVVLAPMSRFRVDSEHVVNDIAVEYYSQRASTPGTFLLTESTSFALKTGGFPRIPGMYTAAQISQWKKVVDAVHSKGSFIYAQLWAAGRMDSVAELNKIGASLVSASDVSVDANSPTPRPMTLAEINEWVDLLTTAAKAAVFEAGFDGVEIHGANACLVDQFIQDVSNKRTDDYGGSVANRTRLALEMIESVSAAIGQKKTAFRIGPWTTGAGNCYLRAPPKSLLTDETFCPGEKNPIPVFSHLVEQIRDRFPDFAYLHIIEPRVNIVEDAEVLEGQSNDFIRQIWGNRPLISAGGYTRELAIAATSKPGSSDLIAFGRPFLANPDLPKRLLHNIPLNEGDRATYYVFDAKGSEGYTSYPFA